VPNSELAIVSRPQALSSEIARQWLVKFAEVCQKDFSSALAAIWDEQLRDIPPDALERACDRLLRNWTTGFLPVPGNIREIVNQEAAAGELQRMMDRDERQSRDAFLEHQRAIAYAEDKQRRLLAAPRAMVDMTNAAPIRETPHVIDFEGRSAELRRQAKLIQEKYPAAKKETAS
jgi:hypothetical protein